MKPSGFCVPALTGNLPGSAVIPVGHRVTFRPAPCVDSTTNAGGDR